MKRAIITIGLAILIFSELASALEDWYFYESGKILPGEQWANVYVYNDSTIVDMNGGFVDGIALYNASTVNVTGGHAYQIETWGNGTINVSGGIINGLGARINGTITISENASTISVHAFDFGKVIMTGGTAYYFGAGENGIVDLFGGEIIDSLSAGGSSLVNIYGNYLTKFQTGGKYNFGYVHGFWFDSDSTEFTIDLSGSETYSRINLIPEPASLLLFGFGALVLRRKR